MRSLTASGSPRARLVVLLALVAVAGAAGMVVVGPRRAAIVALVGELGVLAPVAGVLVYAAFTLLLVPGVVLTVSAGVLFGPWLGTLVAFLGGAIGATAAFALSRTLGREQVRRLASGYSEQVDEWTRRHGALALAFVRVFPLVPYNVVNYAAGVSAISARDYVLGTLLGLGPGAFIYATFGGYIDEPTSPPFIGAVALIVLVAAGGPLLKRRFGDADAAQ